MLEARSSVSLAADRLHVPPGHRTRLYVRVLHADICFRRQVWGCLVSAAPSGSCGRCGLPHVAASLSHHASCSYTTLKPHCLHPSVTYNLLCAAYHFFWSCQLSCKCLYRCGCLLSAEPTTTRQLSALPPCRRTLVRAAPDLAHFFLIIFLILVTVALAATAALGELIVFFATLSGGLWQSSACGGGSTEEALWQSGAFHDHI